MLDELDAVRGAFVRRVNQDADALLQYWSAEEPNSPALLSRIKHIAHGLAGAGGIFGFPQISSAAAKLEEAIIIHLDGGGTLGQVERALERLLTGIEMSR
jgi:HPt (histidine-containing phosphotransfer) domain-containing protein